MRRSESGMWKRGVWAYTISSTSSPDQREVKNSIDGILVGGRTQGVRSKDADALEYP